MRIENVADLIAETLQEAGVARIYGVVGDSLNGITEALRARGKIDWIHTRHEEAAAFAASAEAQVTGKLAVCAGSCGPGNLHLINGLYDAHRSRTPVLAIAAQIPAGATVEVEGHTDDQGTDAYNRTLSEARAAAVAAWLTANAGVPAASIRTAGLGETAPAASNADEAGRAQNRRVVITVTAP